MFSSATYIPFMTVRPSEMQGLRRLPDADKDALLPSIRIGKLNGSHQLARTFEGLEKAFGTRSIIADLVSPPTEVKHLSDQQLVELNQPTNGHAAWTGLMRDHSNFLPTVQWGPSANDLIRQTAALLELNRGLVLRLRRNNHWDLASLQTIASLPLRQVPLLVVLDFGQLTGRLDDPSVTAELMGVMNSALQIVGGGNVTITTAMSSFPPEFASIHREHARLPIRERGVFTQLAASAPLFGGVPMVYGDYASVCMNKSGFAQSGAPRVDLASRNEWVYFRREVDQCYIEASKAVMADSAWQDGLALWGTNEIRRAAGGDVTDLHYQRAWVGVRINVHLHQQLHYSSPNGGEDTDEAWED